MKYRKRLLLGKPLFRVLAITNSDVQLDLFFSFVVSSRLSSSPQSNFQVISILSIFIYNTENPFIVNLCVAALTLIFAGTVTELNLFFKLFILLNQEHRTWFSDFAKTCR